ncbi:flippase-like domain-containing protein [Chitinophagaceae bacterium LB-8]|uniref:Flippase-like domain-containing protein n=1 Tax=Paraflavisolibacter caeni TaxID=2982496 RepID=A0A9X2XXG4_9BACT|nr:lysylphosphatidylglycerol synthase transmembrane domain-containing protein [Paraflavisolibacter caeni]MCU7550750.1 flippase-like domain-containing protein [Paraflavisolibacter caeni]
MKSLQTILQYLFFLGLGILFVWLTIKDINQEQWQHIKFSIKNARYGMIAPVFAMIFLSHYSRALRWKILMKPLGYTPTTFNTFAAVMIGYLVNAGVPRLGEVVKCTLLARYENVRADKLIGTIVVERAVDVVCLMVVFILALAFQGHIIGSYTADLFTSFFEDKAGQFSILKLALFLFGVVTFIALIYTLLKRFGHIDAVAKVKKIILGVLLGLNSIRLIKNKGLFIFHTLFIWTMYLASTTAGIYALRETDHLGIGAGLATLGIGSIGMIVTPGGIGAYPYLVTKLMLLYQISEETGTALGWLLWSAQTIIILFGGLILAALFSYHNKNKKTIAHRQHHIP